MKSVRNRVTTSTGTLRFPASWDRSRSHHASTRRFPVKSVLIQSNQPRDSDPDLNSDLVNLSHSYPLGPDCCGVPPEPAHDAGAPGVIHRIVGRRTGRPALRPNDPPTGQRVRRNTTLTRPERLVANSK